MTKSKGLRMAGSEGLAMTKDYGILVFLFVGRPKVRAEADLGSYTVSLRSPWRLLSARDSSYAREPLADHKSWLQFNILTIGSTKPTLTTVLRTSCWEIKSAMGGLVL